MTELRTETEASTESFDSRLYNWTTHRWGKSISLDAIFVALAQWTPIVMLSVIVLAATGFAWNSHISGSPFVPAVTSVVSAMFARLLNEPITRVSNRPRPFEQSLVPPLLRHDEGGSFPSNHATGAFALAFGFLQHTPYPLTWYFFILVILAVLLALARVYTGLHYLTDVLAGSVNGMVVAVLVGALIHRVLMHL
ncbi:phosphatase PAP2 family protein [Alicyclobacillus mengziensis]|uniref:Phosphatase PAP2 family protein n=1 Tax=Alicyclobacillus mengziensis TaxID=2931921 RepID=A0A9X7W1Q0_9BACL|nr:phosphatase PAP2 family protein [Alicyclobacillus mengziensis]QSO49121.1 phosphatase PAP2 family protein [Alicyclobacillus mengziensis]